MAQFAPGASDVQGRRPQIWPPDEAKLATSDSAPAGRWGRGPRGAQVLSKFANRQHICRAAGIVGAGFKPAPTGLCRNVECAITILMRRGIGNFRDTARLCSAPSGPCGSADQACYGMWPLQGQVWPPGSTGWGGYQHLRVIEIFAKRRDL